MDDYESLVGTPPPADLLEAIAPQQEAAATDEKYGSLKGLATSAAQGFTEGVVGPLGNMAARALGSDPKELRDSRDANPISHGLGVLGGLTASTLASAGLAPILEHAAAPIAAHLVPEALMQAPSMLAKVGSAAVKGAVENTIFQGSDEMSKLVLGDPEQSMSSAVSNMGLAAALGAGVGGAFGSVSPLWEATEGTRVGQMLRAIVGKSGGMEGASTDSVQNALDLIGVEVPTEVRAALSSDPKLQQIAKTLEQSDTTSSGQAFQKSLVEFRSALSQHVNDTLAPFGNRVSELSEAEAGKKVGDSLAAEFGAHSSPIARDYEIIRSNLDQSPLPYFMPGEIAQTVAETATKEGWHVSPSSDIMQLVNRTLKEVPNLKKITELSQYITAVGDAANADPLNGSLRRAGGIIKDVLRNAETAAIEKEFGDMAPGMLDRFRDAQRDFARLAKLKDALDDRLHIGGAVSSYGERVAEMARTEPEKLLRKLGTKTDADLLGFLSESFPKAAEELRKFHIDSILDKAANKAKPGEVLSVAEVRKLVDNMPPELRDFAIPKMVQDKVNAVGDVVDRLHSQPHNFSNTARTIDSLMSYLPGSMVGMVTMAVSHNPAMGLLLAGLTKTMSKDAPDAMRLAFLRFAGSNQGISPTGFKAMVDTIQHMVKGEAAMGRAAKAVFNEGSEVIINSAMPTSKDREVLDKALKVSETNPESLLNTKSQLGHYMPEHSAMLSQIGSTAVNYLNSLRPVSAKASPLDHEKPINPVAQAAYHRALDIAENPLMVTHHISKGTLTQQDVTTLSTVMPGVYRSMTAKLSSAMMEHVTKGDSVSYQTRMGLSLFLGQPLDSTLSSTSIASAQPVQEPQGQPQGQSKAPSSSTSKLSKISLASQTPLQARQTREVTKV